MPIIKFEQEFKFKIAELISKHDMGQELDTTPMLLCHYISDIVMHNMRAYKSTIKELIKIDKVDKSRRSGQIPDSIISHYEEDILRQNLLVYKRTIKERDKSKTLSELGS